MATTTGQFAGMLSKESGSYCPLCRDLRQAPTVNLARNGHLFECAFGHKIPYMELMSMRPDMKQFITREIPNPSLDVKTDLFLRKEIWNQFSAKYAGRVAATLNSVLATMLDGDFMFLTGDTVRKLKKQHVNTQEDVLAMVNDNIRLCAENEAITKENIDLKNGKGSAVDYTQIAKLVAQMQANGEIEV